MSILLFLSFLYLFVKSPMLRPSSRQARHRLDDFAVSSDAHLHLAALQLAAAAGGQWGGAQNLGRPLPATCNQSTSLPSPTNSGRWCKWVTVGIGKIIVAHYLYIYTCVCILDVHTYMYMYTHIQYIYIYRIFTLIQTNTHTHIIIYIYIYIHIYI